MPRNLFRVWLLAGMKVRDRLPEGTAPFMLHVLLSRGLRSSRQAFGLPLALAVSDRIHGGGPP
jgi:hypothetical protein